MRKSRSQKFGGNRQNGMKKSDGNRAQMLRERRFLRQIFRKNRQALRGLYQRPAPKRGRSSRPRVYDDVFVNILPILYNENGCT